MWWALRDITHKNCQTTIQKESTKMFWLGYFLKKRIQDENFQKIVAFNRGQLEQWLVDHELRSYYFINQARKSKLNYFSGKTSQRTEEMAAFKSAVREQLKTYVVEDSVNVQYYQRHVPAGENGQFGKVQLVQHLVDIRNVSDLWEGRFVFKYDLSLKDEIKFDDIEFYEKQQEELKNYQRAKWVDCLFFWF